jgi:hypothetical protein
MRHGEHADNENALGFAPHGAGRNLGRKAFLRENHPTLPAGIDVRFYCGKPDLSDIAASLQERCVRPHSDREVRSQSSV